MRRTDAGSTGTCAQSHFDHHVTSARRPGWPKESDERTPGACQPDEDPAESNPAPPEPAQARSGAQEPESHRHEPGGHSAQSAQARSGAGQSEDDRGEPGKGPREPGEDSPPLRTAAPGPPTGPIDR